MICFYCLQEISEKVIAAREMMFGKKDPFDYAKCDYCESFFLCLYSIPIDMSKYYPSEYYSYSQSKISRSLRKSYILKRRGLYELGQFNNIGYVLNKIKPGYMPVLRDYGLRYNHSVLDVGCGGGAFLFELAENGMQNLVGCDPFLATVCLTAP